MNIKELIDKLKEFDEELEVMLYTDHGQIADSAYSLSEMYVDCDGEIVAKDGIDLDYPDEVPSGDLKLVICS